MKDANLVRMANQIARNFAAYSEDEAVQETHDHIRSFWDPRMRQQIREYVTGGAAGLDTVAVKAIQQLKDPTVNAHLKVG